MNDVVAAIDGTRLDQVTVAEATQLLKTAPGSHVTLEIIPGTTGQSRIPFCRGEREREREREKKKNQIT